MSNIENIDKYFDDLEMLEGGSPADVGLDATRTETELTPNEREELEALRAFKSYFDDCMVGQGYEIANFHMNGELEPFDNFFASAMEEYSKAIEKSGNEQSTIDFSNCADLTADIYFNEAKEDVPAKADVIIIPSSMEMEENLIERTDICERIGLSAFGIHDAQMSGEDIRVNFYGIYDENQNVSLELVVDAGDSFYESAIVPLRDSEKESLKNAMETACQSLTKQSLEEFIAESNKESQGKQTVDIDFHNTVDSNVEITNAFCNTHTHDGKVEVILFLTDAQYEAIANRTDCERKYGKTFSEMLHDDTTMNVYVDVYPDSRVEMTLEVQSEFDGWDVFDVPLNDSEKTVLTTEIDREVREQLGMSLESLLQQITGWERDEKQRERLPEPKKHKSDERDDR